jgi:DNA-binding transcriptional regulator LsrR (DeoR family)
MNENVMKTIGRNVTAVMDEAGDMVDTVAQTQGEDFATLVRLILVTLASNKTMAVALSGRDEPFKNAMTNCFTDQMASILGLAGDLAGVPKAVMTEAFAVARKLDSTVNDLMDRAVESGVKGKDFG